MWKNIQKDGFPKKEGAYLTCHKHVNYPYNVSITYYDGDSGFISKEVLPLTHWRELPEGPDTVKTQTRCSVGVVVNE